jgi:hypothetical protein
MIFMMASEPNKASSNRTVLVPCSGNILMTNDELMRFSSILSTISQTSCRGEPKINTTSEAYSKFLAREGMILDIGFPLRDVMRNFTSDRLLEISDRL